MLYLDSSALVKLVVDERESAALAADLGESPLAGSALSRTEVVRAVARADPRRVEAAVAVVASLALIDISGAVLHAAARLAPRSLRSLDAIHLASALELEDDLTAFVAYDERLLDAASALGMPVSSPGRDS